MGKKKTQENRKTVGILNGKWHSHDVDKVDEKLLNCSKDLGFLFLHVDDSKTAPLVWGLLIWPCCKTSWLLYTEMENIYKENVEHNLIASSLH